MKEVSQKLRNAAIVMFQNELTATSKKINQFLSQQSIVEVNEEKVDKCLYNLLEYQIWRLCHKTFVYEFHQYRQSLFAPADQLSTRVFDQYVSSIDEQTMENWFNKYEYLGEIVSKTVINTCCYLEEVFLNFRNDIETLVKKEFISEKEKLENVVFLDSDPHNGSKIVLCFEFTSQEKILYKPKSLEIDLVIDRIFSNILKFDSLKNFSPVAKTLSRELYGWQLFISNKPISNEEIGDAYFNMGLCTSLFSVLGATDMHDENVIFSGTTPYFIDLETSIQPAYFSSISSLNTILEDELVHSIVGTSILPAKIVTFPYKVLIGAINTPYPQKTSEMLFAWKNIGTDAIDIAKDNITVTRDIVPLKLSDNSIPDPLPYQKNFIEGYIEGYRKINENKKLIECELTNVECPIRVVVRPTMQYTLMLDACLFPENLTSKKAFKNILKYLKSPKLVRDTKISKDILNEEIYSLMGGDIPYFSMKSNEKALRSDRFCSDAVFDESPASNSIENLKKMSEKKLLLDQRLIAEGYSDIRIQEAEYKKEDNIGHLSPLFIDVVQKMSVNNPFPLIELIQKLAISTNDKNIEAGWIGGVYGGLPISYNSTPFVSFHDTGGILFLLEHLNEDNETSKDSTYSDLYIQASRGLKTLQNAYYSDLKVIPQSVISGPSSIEYIFEHKNKRSEIIERHVCSNYIEKDGIGDIFSGEMGEILLLSTFSETPIQILETFQKKLILEENSEKLIEDGIAHGRLGQLWTQFRISYALNNIEQCWDLYKKVKKISFEKKYETSGWCNGNAGLLMVLVEMSAILKTQSDFYEIADKAMILPNKGEIDLSVCHGAAGVVQSLLYAYQILGDSWYLSKATSYWQNVLELAMEQGFYTGEKNRDYLLGYFLGWGGIADSALLLKMYNAGESVWFPLNISSTNYQNICFNK